jgi:hypothetical protein
VCRECLSGYEAGESEKAEFIEKVCGDRALLTALISRAELSGDRRLTIHFRFGSGGFTLPAARCIAHREKSAGEAEGGAGGGGGAGIEPENRHTCTNFENMLK